MRALISALLLTLAWPVQALGLAQEREDRFMQGCMTDATVAAGQRAQLCRCIYRAYAYGMHTTFGVSDLLTVPDRDWEAPARRLSRDELGNDVRRVRQRCLNAVDR